MNAYARDVGDVFDWTGSQVFTLTSSLCCGALANPAYRPDSRLPDVLPIVNVGLRGKHELLPETFFRLTEIGFAASAASIAGRLHEVLRPKMQAITEMLASNIVTEKLSGQVLHRRTGILAGSVHAVPVTDAGTTTIHGAVESSAGPAFYGKIHEYRTGGRGWEIRSVGRRALAFQMSTKQVSAKSVFHPALPARSFMGSSLDESRDQIIRELGQAVADVLKEK